MASSTTSSSSTSSSGYPANETQPHCPICHKQFTFAGSQRIHYTYSDCKHLYCKPCQAVFPTPAALDRHLRSVHGPPLTFCSGCATWYADVDEERWKHRGRCFGRAGFERTGFGFGGAQTGGRGAKEGKKEGDQWSEARSSSKGQQQKREQSSKSDNHHNTTNNNKEDQSRSEDRSNTAGNDKPVERSSDLYERLRVHPLSTDAEIAQAAKKRRIEVHPDRERKPGMTERELNEIDEIAKEVGYAADVLQDAEKKRRYDRERRGRR
ncbi:MAG: hypothetical protein Q9184_001709 [Pyrenodesmia sp. 2 TL-2023]